MPSVDEILALLHINPWDALALPSWSGEAQAAPPRYQMYKPLLNPLW